MKKLFTLAITGVFALAAGLASAQSTRMAFIEEATQASCPPCAALNPVLIDMVDDNTENVILLAYQVWWPGFDQMYLDNTAEVDDRVGVYYSFLYAPQIVMQGQYVTGSGSDGALGNLTQAKIDDINEEDSEFDMTLSASLEDGMLTVTGSVEATMVADGDFKLRIMIAEELITIEDAPGGTNGETEYHHVFKSFIGGSDGIDLENSWAIGDSYTIDETFDISDLTIYHLDGLEVIAIVQNDDDKYVHQAVKDHDVEITVDFENSAAAGLISGLPNSICLGEQTLSPVFKLINHGNVDLTSATLTYNINGGDDQTYDWTGSLSTMGSENVELDAYTFDAEVVNTITVTVSLPNGVADEDVEDNNTSTAELDASPDAGMSVEIEILTDAYGDETYWEIRNSAGDIVEWGGNPNVGLDNIGLGIFPPPSDPAMYGNNEQVSVIVDLPANDCYTFHITDYYGDGFLGAGYYQVNDENGDMIIAMMSFSIEEMNNFSGDAATSIEELSIADFRIYPNPTSDIAHVSFNLVQSENVLVEVLDLSGRVVYTENMGQLNAGTQMIDINAKQIGNGMYIFNVYAGNSRISKRVSISK